MDSSITTKRLLIELEQAGIELRLDGDKLMVKGGQQDTALHRKISQCQDEIVYALQHVPGEVMSYYRPRLLKGIRYMEDTLHRLKRDPENKKLMFQLVNNMALWAQIDDEMRRLYPEFKGCPVDSCTSKVPVRCVYCATDNKEWRLT